MIIILVFCLITISVLNGNIFVLDDRLSRADNSTEGSQTTQQTQIDPQHEPDPELSNSRGAREIDLESNVHGGSWLDSFNDDFGVNWIMSDQILLNKSNVRLKKLILSKPFQKDPYTVALYHFDEGSGVIAQDETENHNNGTLGGDGLGTDIPVWTTGAFDTALGFDGVDDYIAVPDNSTLRLREAFTLHVWVKPISSTGVNWQTILEKGQDSYGLYFSNVLRFQVYNGGLTPVSIQTPPVILGEWYHLVSTYSKYEGSRKLYLNGELVASSSHSSNISNSVNTSLGINRHPNNGDAFFNGIIDEVAICNRSLTALEINELYGGNRYHFTGNMTSKIISLPVNMHWDTIIINKTQPKNSYINVTILNASNDQPIPGSLKYIDEGEFDISYIDPSKYPAIKLNATFESNGSVTPILHSWGVSWVGKDCWKDTFFGGDKLDDDEKITMDGNVVLSGTKYGIGTIDPNTAAIWHFDEGSGTVVEDASNNDKDGNLFGGVSWTSGKFGTGLHFNGVYAQVYTPQIFSGNGDITISAWVKFNTTSNSSFPRIIFIGKPNSNQAIQMYAMQGTGQFGVSSWNGNRAVTTKEYNDGAWHQVVGRFHDQNTYEIFVDGELEASNSGQYSIPSDGVTMLGGRPDAEYWNGTIDEVAVYKRSLTDLEIRNWYYSITNITSSSIELPAGYHWDTIIINKTEPSFGWTNITILDGKTNIPIMDYINLKESVIDISSLHPINFTSIKLTAQPGIDRAGLMILHDWSVNWTKNTPPKINGISPEANAIYRTNIIQIFIDVSDTCDPPERLMVSIEYKSPEDTTWQSSYLYNLEFIDGSWVITFIPTKEADIGYYSFKISCKDSFNIENTMIFENIVEVKNNLPTKPDVIILPKSPTTFNDLIVYATNSTDIENEPITYFYQWYKNNEFQPELTSELVSANYTNKNEQWKCVVTPNDGNGYDNGNGTSAEVGVFVRNIEPEILDPGDQTAEVGIPFELKLEVLDADNNLSDVTWSLQSNIGFISFDKSTGVLTGTATIDDLGYFYININVSDGDGGFDDIQFILNIIRVNRPPIITTVDIKSAKTGELFYIDYNATDDFTNPDFLKWSVETNASWLEMDNNTGVLSGTPLKADAGWVWVNISVEDNENGITYHYFIINVSRSPNEIPKLFNFRMLPSDGDTKTEFTFSVNYLDGESEPPVMIQIVIDEVAQSMELFPGQTAYNGKYGFTTKLTKGEHSYYFTASDGTDTVSSDTFQTTYIKEPKENGPPDVLSTWVIMLIIIIIIIVIILSFIILIRKKKQRAKEEEILLPQPQAMRPMVYSAEMNGQTLLPMQMIPPSVAETDQITNLPVNEQNMQEQEIEESSDFTIQQISVDLPSEAQDTEPTSEPIIQEQESDSSFNFSELLPDDSEYIVSESPELIESPKSSSEESKDNLPESDIDTEIIDQESETSGQNSLESKKKGSHQ